MLSPLDLMVAFGAALLLFGPDQLPQVARKVGRVTRDLQNTSQAFIREMERAADFNDLSRVKAEPWVEEMSYPQALPAPDLTLPVDEPLFGPDHDPWSLHAVPYVAERWIERVPAARPLV